MATLLIIGAAADSTNDLPKLAKDIEFYGGLKTTITDFESLIFYICDRYSYVKDAKTQTDVASYDVVMFDNKIKYQEIALAAALHLQSKKVPFINKETVKTRSTSKLSQYMLLALNGYQIPKTLYTNRDIMSALDLTKRGFSFPLILKDIRGQKGNNNFLVKNHDDLKKHLYLDTKISFLLQEFIPNKSDMRIISMCNEIIAVIERRRQTSTTHLNNISKGAGYKLINPKKLPDDLLKKTVQVARMFNRELAGVDLVLKDNTYVFLEVNSAPGLSTKLYPPQVVEAFTRALKSKTG